MKMKRDFVESCRRQVNGGKVKYCDIGIGAKYISGF